MSSEVSAHFGLVPQADKVPAAEGASVEFPGPAMHITYLSGAQQSFFSLDQVRELLAAPPAKLPQEAQPGEPLFLLHCGKIDSDGEQGDWDCEADSGKRVDEFAALHPGQTVKLYAAPQPARAGAVELEEVKLVIQGLVQSNERWGLTEFRRKALAAADKLVQRIDSAATTAASGGKGE